ncbi:hypothetical protein AA0242T_2531 [Acetobacter aceti NRIC 0242]|uniref:Uncharacterized protein n=1 Tax=Acetobacter aceti NBRC 14818 TaxID=887700 RepID=A0AB33I6U7_ACEAC|nr:hypothetical protein [Acetobacter aceti]TCS34857.1 hypothetical protein EDC15_10266 [Acetobacter aceti NBRC 14818]BCK74565.1 hypothetical protein EMQ_0171 [Acetobacter aceti NBRC 14818]GAN56074.1 hypothetical protein Abac_002_223 [Acetobacter aceti NBRC 14818]GBO81829.1 hypothetical protein AA0242T_2531 [Acetobacter aceti NRIC 0242]
MRQNEVIFANFTLRFGNGPQDKVFLDLATEIVLPAFFDSGLIRNYGDKTSYFFHRLSLKKLEKENDDSWVIYGQFIKNTTISREQIFKDGEGIVRNPAELATAPSAFFVLILSNHRIIYLSETKDAPDLKAFKATVLQFVRKKYEFYINKLHEENKEKKNYLRTIYKPPTLEVVPLTGKEDISDFIDRYKILRRIEFDIIIPNEEIDAKQMFDAMRDFSQAVDSTKTQFIMQNKNGLDADQAKEEIEEATRKGNQTVHVSGVDHNNQKLVGNNEEFKISTQLVKPEVSEIGKARQLWSIFKKYTKEKMIDFGGTSTQKVLSLPDVRNKNE